VQTVKGRTARNALMAGWRKVTNAHYALRSSKQRKFNESISTSSNSPNSTVRLKVARTCTVMKLKRTISGQNALRPNLYCAHSNVGHHVTIDILRYSSTWNNIATVKTSIATNVV